LTTQLLIRVVPTITASIASGSERCACLVSAFELLGSAGVVDVGRRQNRTVFLIVSHRTVSESVTDLVPLDTLRPVSAQVSPAEVSCAPEPLILPLGTVHLAIAQLPLVNALQVAVSATTRELLPATCGLGERLNGCAELSLVLTMPTVPHIVTNAVQWDTTSVRAHEFLHATTGRSWWGRRSRTEITFILTESTISLAITNKLLGNTSVVLARELVLLARRLGHRGFWDLLTVGALVSSVLAVPSPVAHKVLGDAGSVGAHEVFAAAEVSGFRRRLSWTEFPFIFSPRAIIDTVAHLIFKNARHIGTCELS